MPIDTKQTVFAVDVTEHTPAIVKELVGQPIEHAAKVMALALLESELCTRKLARHLGARGKRVPGEALFECAVRTLSELGTQKAYAEAKIQELQHEIDTASNVLSELELGFLLAGCSACFKPGRSLPQRARDIVSFVKKFAVRTTVMTQTVTIARSEPVLP